jgi:hypothetical protein
MVEILMTPNICGDPTHGYIIGENECRICKRDASEAGSKTLIVKISDDEWDLFLEAFQDGFADEVSQLAVEYWEKRKEHWAF